VGETTEKENSEKGQGPMIDFVCVALILTLAILAFIFWIRALWQAHRRDHEDRKELKRAAERSRKVQ